LLRELRVIFPVKRSPNAEYSIGGIVLPNLPSGEEMINSRDPYPKHDKELIAAGLGLVCHLLTMISNYTGVRTLPINI
jgi:hypothetical protein